MIPAQAVEAAYSAPGAGAYVNKEDVRLMLEAAAPHMLAAAWDEGYGDAIDAFDGRNVSNPYRTPDAR